MPKLQYFSLKKHDLYHYNKSFFSVTLPIGSVKNMELLQNQKLHPDSDEIQ